MSQKIGPREQQLREMRNAAPRVGTVSSKTLRETGSFLAKVNLTAEEAKRKAATKPAATAPAKPEESAVKKRKKKAAPRKPAAKTSAKPRAAAKPKARPRATVSAQEVADFMVAAGGEGVAMADLVKRFGIEAHPMRAKIYNVRHGLGISVETKDGRYYATAPAAQAAE